MTDVIRADHTALFHNGLGGPQTALPVLVVDQRQYPVVTLRRTIPVPRLMLFDHRSDQVGNQSRTHGARSPGIKISHQGDPFFSVERTLSLIHI